MTQWYYSDSDRNRLGPVSGSDLAQLHALGQLRPETLVWREGMGEWTPWRSVMGEVLAPEVPVTATQDSDAQRASAANSQYNPYAIAEPRVRPAVQDAHSPYAPPRTAVAGDYDYVADGEVVYAGFWKRYAAYMIDTVLLMIVFGIAGAVFGVSGTSLITGKDTGAFGVFYVLQLALMMLYFGWMHASVNQATLGKLAVGIKVTDDDGERISLLRGIGRFFATIPSSLILCIGYLMAAFTDRKRALHDMIASTLVVDRWAFTSQSHRQRHELGGVTITVIVLSTLLMVFYFAMIVVFIGVLAGMSR
ncbi:RDD family protein [Lysobacter sp. LF1]|uniref:RDD family protein n=1 Tax=Lysobacter stagni TaxID=3045172 RepID=A0ABT6XDZ6_9GAMM|nr:RDD family protein [Lysobacter sp. LF1]MDI9238361.1 RDD family protein [Lysobacter sp. LF1]